MTPGQAVMSRALKEYMGFLTSESVRIVAADPVTRLEALLVRCGGGRFIAPAQDIAHFIGIIEREAGDDCRGETGQFSDYVRDVSVPAGWTPTRGLSFDPTKGVGKP